MMVFRLTLLLVLAAPVASAQDVDDFLAAVRTSGDLERVFEPLAFELDASVVRVRGAEDREILGTVVDDRGSILTKASRLGDGPGHGGRDRRR